MNGTNILFFAASCLLTNNYVFGRMLGATALTDDSRSVEASAKLGLVVAAIMTCASALGWIVNSLLLTPMNATYLQVPAFALIVGLLVMAAELFFGDKLSGAAKSPALLTASCALLGAAVINVQAGYGFLEALLNGLFGGLGFLLAVVLLAGVQERIRYSNIPEAMKGAPITLVSAGLVALAFMGFMGIA